jgi:tight adherence protein C
MDTNSPLVRALVADLGGRLQVLLGSRDVADRLARAGRSETVTEFRSSQVVAALIGVAAACVVSAIVFAARTSLRPGLVLGLVVAGAAGGVVERERALDRAVNRRRRAMTAELPTLLDLVCLAVTAGESVHGALELVGQLGTGPLAGEIRSALRATRNGDSLVSALEAVGSRVALPNFDRFVRGVAVAQERGVALAESLHAVAEDVRDAQHRELLEAAGRKQVSMLIPVIGLILPVAVAFAFFPGVVAIRMVAR